MLDGKTIIVTGGGMGIGEAIARTAYAAGGNVVIGDIRADSAGAVAASLGERALAVAGDIRDASAQAGLVQSAVDRFGRVDGLVNNAGVNFVRPFMETTRADWARVLGIDLEAVFFLTQEFCRALLSQSPSQGSIVNIASVHALRGFAGAGPYDAAKAGVVGLTRCLAVEMGRHKIRVNAISPGVVATPLHIEGLAKAADPVAAMRPWHSHIPLNRDTQPSEIGEVAVFLLSDKSSIITGANIVADGGLTAQLAGREAFGP